MRSLAWMMLLDRGSTGAKLRMVHYGVAPFSCILSYSSHTKYMGPVQIYICTNIYWLQKYKRSLGWVWRQHPAWGENGVKASVPKRCRCEVLLLWQCSHRWIRWGWERANQGVENGRCVQCLWYQQTCLMFYLIKT